MGRRYTVGTARLRWRTLVMAAVAFLVIQTAPLAPVTMATHDPASFPFCSATVTSSCISSFLVDGQAPPAGVTVETFLFPGPSNAPSFLAFMLQRDPPGPSGPFELSPALTTNSKVTIRAKLPTTFTPSMATVLGTMESWQWNAATRELSIVAFPRTSSWTNGSCDPGSCPATADVDFNTILLVGVIDATYNPLFASKYQGGFLSFNSQIFSAPDFNPQTSAVEFLVGAPSNKAIGGAQTSTFKIHIPDAVITDLWLYADPATLPATFTKTFIQGIGEVSPTRTRVAATATSPAGWIFEYPSFPLSVRSISIGPANPPAASNPFDAGPIVLFQTCGGGVTVNCVAEFSVNGAAPPAGIVPEVYYLGTTSLQIQAAKAGSPTPQEISPEISTGSTVLFRLKLDATFSPVVMFGTGNVQSWTWNDATDELIVTAKPVAASFAMQCDLFECAQTADFDLTSTLMLGAGSFPIPAGLPAEVAAQMNTFKTQLQGAFFTANAQNYTPPQWDQVTKTIEFRLSAPHFKLAGGLHTGTLSTLITDGVIVGQWGVADPSTLTGAGLKVDIEGQGTVAPQVTRVNATATSPAGILITHSGFGYSTPLISIGQAAPVTAAPGAEVAAPPPDDGGAPSLSDSADAAALVREGPVRLPLSGTVRMPLTIKGAGASLTLGTNTALTTTAGHVFTGILHAPFRSGDPTGGKLTSPTTLLATGGPDRVNEVRLGRPARLTLPVPAGEIATDFQPVLWDSGKLTFPTGALTPEGVAVDVTRLTDRHTVYGLMRITRPSAAPVTRAIASEPGMHARWAGQSSTAELSPGQLVEATVRLQNTGDRPWIRGRMDKQVNLGTIDSTAHDLGLLAAPLWGSDRVATTSEPVVGPGDVGTFAVRLRAPAVPGTYRVYLRPVVDGVAWLEDEGIYLEIVVR